MTSETVPQADDIPVQNYERRNRRHSPLSKRGDLISSCMRCLVFSVNTIIFFVALVLPIAFIWLYKGNSFAVLMTIVTGLCAVVMVVSILGCLSVARGSRCLLTLYLILVALIVIISLIIVILEYGFPGKIRGWLTEDLYQPGVSGLEVANESMDYLKELSALVLVVSAAAFLLTVITCTCIEQTEDAPAQQTGSSNGRRLRRAFKPSVIKSYCGTPILRVKTLFYIIHGIMFLIGLTFPIASIWLYNGRFYGTFMTITTVTCYVLMLASVLGIVGVVKDNKRLLIANIILMILVFAVAITVVILNYGFTKKMQGILRPIPIPNMEDKYKFEGTVFSGREIAMIIVIGKVLSFGLLFMLCLAGRNANCDKDLIMRLINTIVNALSSKGANTVNNGQSSGPA